METRWQLCIVCCQLYGDDVGDVLSTCQTIAFSTCDLFRQTFVWGFPRAPIAAILCERLFKRLFSQSAHLGVRFRVYLADIAIAGSCQFNQPIAISLCVDWKIATVPLLVMMEVVARLIVVYLLLRFSQSHSAKMDDPSRLLAAVVSQRQTNICSNTAKGQL